MNKIDQKIKEIKSKKIGFMGHIIAGFPNYEISLKALKVLSMANVDFIEIQFPFSDPTADGPTIEEACYQAIANGFSVEKGFDLTKEIIKISTTPILIMTYANIIFKYGIFKFLDKAESIGITGVIIPDLLPECDEGLNEYCKKKNIYNILICAPTDTEERIKELSTIGNGFLYTVIRRGITGKKTEISKDTEEWLKTVKNNSSLPIAAGFGIQAKEQIDKLIGKADIVIVGSYFVNQIKKFSLESLDKFEESFLKSINEITPDF